jgi:DNA-binding XRE family transcriptional regulator
VIHTPTDQQTVEPTFAEPQLSYQTIKDASGAIQYVVVPYADFLRLSSRVETAVPNEVAERVIMGKLTPIRAWREHLGLTQSEVAARMEISQAALAQIESPEARPRKTTLRRVAQALCIQLEQLDF